MTRRHRAGLPVVPIGTIADRRPRPGQQSQSLTLSPRDPARCQSALATALNAAPSFVISPSLTSFGTTR